MLSKDEFKDAIIEEIRDRLPSDYSVTEHQTIKERDTVLTGLNAVKEGNNVGVVLYAEHLYEDYSRGASVEEVAEGAVKVIQENTVERGSIPDFSREYILDHVFLRMANGELNQRRFEHVPTMPVQGAEEIVLYPCVEMEVNGHMGVTVIRSGMIEDLGISVEELHSAAQANTEKRVQLMPLRDWLARMMPEMDQEALDNPIILAIDRGRSNSCGDASLFGAPGLLKQLKEDCYIIPSSIHELLLIPKSEISDGDFLHQIVHDVNRSALEPEEFLSDHVFETTGGTISTVKFEKEAEQKNELDYVASV